jgi:hypothetical protein
MPSESRTDIDVTPGRRPTRGARPLRSGGRAAVTTETILDLVDRLGLIDLVVSRVRTRLQDVDFDEILDEIGDYVRRNPEVLVVGLATITVSAGLIVYLNQRRDARLDVEEEIEKIAERERQPATSRPSTSRSTSSTRPGRH